MNEMNETRPQPTLTSFFDSIVSQLHDVRELRQKYDDENRINGHVPKWKQVGNEKYGNRCQEAATTLARNQPSLTDEEAEEKYQTMSPQVWYPVKRLRDMWQLEYKDVRRVLFWLSRRHFITHDAGSFTYMRREGRMKGTIRRSDNFYKGNCDQQPFPSRADILK